jgi:membrane protease YdiL (CAAX protease family)
MDQAKDDETKDDKGLSNDSKLDGPAPTSPPSDYALLKPTATPSPSPFDDRVQKIFIGPDGLRPIWRFALYLLLYLGLRFILRLLIYYALPPMGRLWFQITVELGFAIIALTPALVMSQIENRPIGIYGLPWRNAFGRQFWMGGLWGIISLSILLLALRGTHVFDFGGLALHGVRVLKFALFWAVFFLIVAFYEEFFTRGYAQFTLTQAVGFWQAAVLLSASFGVLHLDNPGESSVGILGAVLIGFFFCLTLRRTGNLWFAIGFHAAWDWGESYFYSVPDSGEIAPGHLLHSSLHGPNWLTGGSVGPEGSVFLFVLLALLWVVFDRMYPEVKYPAGISNSRF